EDFFLLGLVFVARCRTCILRHRLEDRWNNLLGGRDLRNHRLEAREEQRADIELVIVEARHDLVGDHLRLRETYLLDAAQFDDLDYLLLINPAKLVGALTTDTKDFDVLALVRQPVDGL